MGSGCAALDEDAGAMTNADELIAAACTDLTVGASVEVGGALQPDGSVNASEIEQESGDGEDGGGGGGEDD